MLDRIPLRLFRFLQAPRRIRRRAREVTLVGGLALVLLLGAALAAVLDDRRRALEAAAQELARVADATAAAARLVTDAAQRQLDDVAAGVGAPGEDIAASLRRMVSRTIGARGAVVLSPQGELRAATGEIEATDPALLRREMLPWLQHQAPLPWLGMAGGVLWLAQRLTAPDGTVTGAVALALGGEWLATLAQQAGIDGEGELVLLDADRQRAIVAGPAATASLPAIAALLRDAPVSGPVVLGGSGRRLLAFRPLLPGRLELAVLRGVDDVLAGWWRRATTTAAVLAGVFALLLFAGLRLRHRIVLLQRQNLRHMRQLAQLATISERLSRLRDLTEIAARAESAGRSLLSCECVEVQLCRGPVLPPEPASRQRGVELLSTGGERLGRLVLTRGAGEGFTAEDELLLEQFARAVASALEGATLLADTMRSKSELEMILSTISDGMVVLDPGWVFRYVNAAAARYLQRPCEEMLGACLWELFPGLTGSEMAERLQTAAATGQDAVFTSAYPPLNAWFELRAFPFAGGLTLYFRDVTAQRETEEKLRQAQKLEAIGQLTNGIAHDVNNLLTVILGNLELLALRAEDRERGVPEPEEERGLDITLAEAGLRAGESASRLMHRLLAFSRRQALAPQVVATADLLQSLQPLLDRTLSEQVTLRMHWPADLWLTRVDPAELESAILNLTINAKDAMPGGGTLIIEAANVTIDRVYAAVAGVERTGDHVMISVADTGIGMGKEVMARAFDPFFTTKAPGKGTGLGLSMVYGFTRQSGGHVLIDSEPGQGTMVRLYLPRALPEDGAGEAEVRPGVAGGDETILLVEDNDLVRAHTETMLRGLGYTVVAAPDGATAIRRLVDGLGPDLLLTDVILPGGMTGRDVAERAQRLVPGLKVLFISGYAGNVLMENGRLPPGVDLLGKPFRRSELAARIRAQLAPETAPPLERA
ncbi:Histidine kinase [Rhodovastum atsumiense]|uniref:histidine kinase n=1 Tax=Rhodovastum atsumiense TaxID=504468 RepID=A0A5M6IV48_9PROT|nr:ATP-binding protein [Rhodovastum atsumiense]KAA5611275.1 response regulator [Rhodovastum atsumiense]CAH2601739.1 Histidine kinase [Rhodovastum atsumiense]